MNKDRDFDDVRITKRQLHSSRARWSIFAGLLVPFTALTYLVVSSGSPSDVRDRPVVLTTLATLTGPFTAAIARNGQGCCLSASLHLAAICGPVLALGLVTQAVPLPFMRGREAARLSL